jgi:lipopolysaccharide export system protein LptC
MIKLDKHTLYTTTDMTINHLVVHQFNTKGQLVNALETPVMHHIALNDMHILKTPHIVIAQEDQPAWEIHADQATSQHGGEEITFNKHVIIHQAQDEHTLESTLKTESMTYFPKDKLATTPLEVTYERPGNTVQSTGIKAYFAEKRVLLLSNARGTYVPKPG